MKKLYPCILGIECVRRTSDGGALTAQPGSLCHWCVEDIEEKRSQLPSMVGCLRAFIGFQPIPVGASKVNGTRAHSLPMNVHVFDLITAIQVLLDDLGSVPMRDVVKRRYNLSIWFEGVCRVEEVPGVRVALKIRSLWLQAEKVIGLQRVWETRHAPCPGCGCSTLGSWSGSGRVECTADRCRLSMTLSEYEAHCIVESRRRIDG